MSYSKPDEKEMRSQFRKFIYRLSTRLVDLIEKRDSIHNSTPELNKISQAVKTLCFLFRVHYRHAYFNVRTKIAERKQFAVFCKNNFQQENLPYFFTFLLNISLKLEMFLYLRDEGLNYFAIFAQTLADYPDYFHFELIGGTKKLASISSFLLDLTKDVQILVNSEYPCRKKLLSLEESISEIEAKYLELSSEKSFFLLKAISQDLYRGLQKYLGEDVLPFIILRFLLDGKVPYEGDNEDKPSVLGNGTKATIVRYFSRCLTPEILSGIAFGGRTRSQLHLSLGISEKFDTQTNFNSTETLPKKTNISFTEWLPIINSLPANGLSLEINSNTNICKKEKKINHNTKDFNSNLSDSDISSSETEHLSVNKPYSNGLEWLKHFDAKTVSLLNPDRLEASKNSHSAEVNASKSICIPVSESAAEISLSVKHKLAVRQKESFPNYVSSEEEQKNLPIKSLSSKANTVTQSKKRSRRKRKKKVKKIEKSDSDDSSFNFTSPVRKLKDNFITAINHTKNLRSWEKKCIVFFMDKAEEFSMEEKLALCKKIEEIPGVQLEDDANIIQMVDLIELEEKSDLLYLEDKNENEDFTGKMPFPECTGNVREEFTELMIRLLAISCDKTIQAAMLGEWVPFLQNILEKDESLLSQIVNCLPNDFLQLLSDQASKQDASQS